MRGNQVSIPISPLAAPSTSIMATREPPDAIPNFKSGLVTSLNAHIETLVAFKGIAETTPLKATSESVLSILIIARVRSFLLVLAMTNWPRNQDRMIGEDLFVELAEISGRTFHVLKRVAEQKDANNLSRLSKELESFGRYSDTAHPLCWK